MKRIKLAVLALVSAAVLAISAFSLYDQFIAAPPPFEAPREVLVKKHDSLKAIALKLAEAGVVRSALATMIYARLTDQEQRLHPGDYEFRGGEDLATVLHHLVKGDFVVITVSVPEGLTVHQIAERIAQAGVDCGDRFEEAARKGDLVSELGLGPLGAEGYLFPATYRFSPRATTAEILGAMLERFFEVLTPSVERRLFDLHLTTRELVTIASIIEKEAKVPSERYLIASVLYNRLRLRMPLQSDPTAQYSFDGIIEPAITAVHTRSAFNTYDFRGLPPGPIANPGLPSIKAALYPAHTDYLYFVARRDGTHIFSRSLVDHNRAVASLRNNGAANSGGGARGFAPGRRNRNELSIEQSH